jgi:hypothetical protein
MVYPGSGPATRHGRAPAHSPPCGATEHGRPADPRRRPQIPARHQWVGWCGRSGPNCLSGRLYRLRGRSRPRPRRRVPSVEPAPPSPASADDPSVTAPPGIATVYAQSPPCLTPTGAGCLPRPPPRHCSAAGWTGSRCSAGGGPSDQCQHHPGDQVCSYWDLGWVVGMVAAIGVFDRGCGAAGQVLGQGEVRLAVAAWLVGWRRGWRQGCGSARPAAPPLPTRC